jgi:uncharacterized protein YjbI with pentapeptide repeats
VRYQRETVATTLDETNPYQGLNAFTSETKQFFFGRDAEIQALVQKIQGCQFLPVIGASGSGKSSIVRAGLIPRLEALGWTVVGPMKPGTNPKLELQELLDREFPPFQWLKPPDFLDDRKIVLVVDQFEEVFTLCRDREERSQFIHSLLNLSEQENLNIRIVVTMRADFVESCLAYEDLTRSIQSDAVYLGPMMGEALEAAIEQPAIVQGMALQPKLLAQILQDVAEEENCLPLLEFALFELWERQVRNRPLTPNSGGTEPKRELKLEAYRKLGGVAGALNAHGEAIYKQLAIQKREHWVQRVMLRLVRTGEGTKDTRQRQRKGDLLEMGKDTVEREAIESVIQSLVDGRLLVSDRIDNQDVIDLSHEALMRSWKRLVTWREGDREVRRIVDAIEDAKRKWIDQGKKRRDLLEGRLLRDGRRSLKDAPAEVLGAKSFIRKSLWWRRIQMAGVIMIPILITAVPAENYWREALVKRDYELIERLGNGDQGERAAVSNLAGGCWAAQQAPASFALYVDRFFLAYFRERVFGNCRSLAKAKLEGASLDFVNLSGADLFMANLKGADLQYSNWSGAFLNSANLSGASLHYLNLSGASLDSINLSGARITHSNWRGAKLSRANLSGTVIHYDVNLSGVDLSEANLSGASLLHAINLSGAWLYNANLKNVKFECSNGRNEKGEEIRHCPDLKHVKWDKETNWQGIQGWENVENIPPALKQQLGLKK